MKKTDYKKELAGYKAKVGKPELLQIPPMNYLQVDGVGDPNTASSFTEAIEALYTVAYTIKFMVKKNDPDSDYGVPPLEAIWWADDMNDFLYARKDKWKWTAMIMLPDMVSKDVYEAGVAAAHAKKDLPALPKLRMECFDEGLCVQVLYIGPYADEGPVIAAIHDFAKIKGYQLRGKHHEIYLSDQRKTEPEKLKTIIRQPIG